MNFIFPQNYNFNSKLFGFIDYNSLILNIIWDGFIFIISNSLFNNLSVKICIIIILCFPLLLFTFVGINNKNIIYVFKYVIKFFIKNKLYLFK